jgi:poly-beta-1,6-N-acetyl-D-glucosamine synthase
LIYRPKFLFFNHKIFLLQNPLIAFFKFLFPVIKNLICLNYWLRPPVSFMAFPLFISVLVYSWVVFKRLWAWLKLKPLVVPPDYKPTTNLSVIVAIRNEEKQIPELLQNLKAQNYPQGLVEIILINDHSEDNSKAVILKFAQEQALNLTLINLADKTEATGKKAAIAAGIKAATGELLVFTDGDCRVQPDWLCYLEYQFTSRQAKFISGPVLYQKPKNMFGQMQLVEFASLIGMGGSSIALGKPNMCNGANMAYPKLVFEEIGGFTGNEQIPSGDDEFIMHKVHALYPNQVYFLKAKPAIVYTNPKPNLKEFFRQRVRWASKWPAYRSFGVKALALLVFITNFFLFAGLLLALAGYFSIKFIVLATGVKILVDMVFLGPVLHFFSKTRLVCWVLPLQFIYIPYVMLTALAGLNGTYSWKGRKIKR